MKPIKSIDTKSMKACLADIFLIIFDLSKIMIIDNINSSLRILGRGISYNNLERFSDLPSTDRL